MFLDRLRELCQRTVRTSENAVEQAVLNQEADRRLIAAFINGLIGPQENMLDYRCLRL